MPADLGPGAVIDGKYRVERILGEGGMGRVVAATHLRLATQVAIKVLLPEMAASAEIAHRFMREARAASALHSDHVCRVMDVGELDGGAPYMVMEMLTGADLAEVILRQGPVDEHSAGAYVLQALDAIGEAHSRGMVHRDLKPANLFLASRPAGDMIKVLDFGIATGNEPGLETRLTRTNTVMGSPGYMSPEQLRSARHVDARSDLWALGVILYELVSGQQPFGGESFTAISIAIATEPHAPLRGVSPAFAAIVDRCLAKDPALRFQAAGELASALEQLAGVVPGTSRVASHNAPTLIAGTAGRAASTTLRGAAGQRAESSTRRSRSRLLIGGIGAGAIIAAILAFGLPRTSERPILPVAGPSVSPTSSVPAAGPPSVAVLPAVPAPVQVSPPSLDANIQAVPPSADAARAPDTVTPAGAPAVVAAPPAQPVKTAARHKHASSATTTAPVPGTAPTTTTPATTTAQPPPEDPWGHMHHDHPGGK